MYLPKSKYKKGSGAGKSLVDAVTKVPFSGPTITDFLGRIFKGSNPNSANEVLESTLPPEPEKDNFVNHYVRPTEKDYIKGTFVRYFAKDSRSGKIVELNKQAYLKEVSDNKLYRRTVKLEWYITGTLEDSIINGYKAFGIKTKNQNVIDQAEKILSGIGEQVLKDTSQFVR